ncbi:MAG: helical backbone metal receptor [Xanthomonadales bacterium]|nr:helical backbone metal receptor [Xanthomonadales bacterium]
MAGRISHFAARRLAQLIEKPWFFGLFLSLATALIPLSANATVNLLNADGSITTLTSPAESVVTLSPNLAELVFAAGGSTKLKAVVEWSDYPQEVKNLPRIGNAFRLDMEQLLILKPDLVIAWDSGNPADVLDKIESLGIPVWRTGVSTPEQIADLLENIGKALATTATAKIAAADYRRELKALVQEYQQSPAFRYFIQLYATPLYTVNGEHLISHALAVCHGVNVFSELVTLAPAVSHEAVLAAAPEVIFYTQSEQPESSHNNTVAIWSPWLGSSPDPHFTRLNPDWITRPGPRLLAGIRQACQSQQQRGHQ